MREEAGGVSKVSPTMGDRVDSTGKKIVVKLAVFVAVSGSAFVFSATSATALPHDAHRRDVDTYISVSGDRNDWSASGSHRLYGHIELILPGGSHCNSPDSVNPKLLNVRGAGPGKVTAIGWKLTSPGKYKRVGEPSVYIS
jgi:hypothetical protein